VFWILLVGADDPARETALRGGLADLSPFSRVLWLAFRVVGAVVVVPVAEELAFRGYLLRRLIAAHFVEVPYQGFRWFAVLGSSLAFGVLHSQFLAGVVVGVIYAVLVCRTGRLFDAVLAHATSNALLVCFGVATDRWALWA
jgi:CAAX prenyl protease-like protein